MPECDELVLRITQESDGSVRVHARAADGAAGVLLTAMPFDLDALGELVERIGHPRRTVRSGRRSELDEAKRLGSGLFNAIVKDNVRDIYRDARRRAESHGRGLRLNLVLNDAPALMAVPWEYLYERPNFLAQSRFTPVVRSLDLTDPRPPQPIEYPLRILAVVSSPRRFPMLDYRRERANLEKALDPLVRDGLVELEWLEAATASKLNDRVSAPDDFHVLHYVGHGAYDDATAGGIVVLEKDDEMPHEVTGEQLGWFLDGEISLRLVVLNSCEGARTSAVDPFSGVASALVEHGIPAIVGMQFEITDDAAVSFATSFYRALAQGNPVDGAMATARLAILAAGHETEFGTPVLFVRGEIPSLFQLPPEKPHHPEKPHIPEEPDKPEKPDKLAKPYQLPADKPDKPTLTRRQMLVGAGVLLITAGAGVRAAWPGPTPPQTQPIEVWAAQVDSRGARLPDQVQTVDAFEIPVGPVKMPFVIVPGGRRLIGSPDTELLRRPNEGPQQSFNVATFAMGRTVVTQAQWAAVVAAVPRPIEQALSPYPSHFKGNGDLPVETISWLAATEFCARLSSLTGFTLRLPSEVEWEYACRADTTTPFHFGPTVTPELANYCGLPFAVCSPDITRAAYNDVTYTLGEYGEGPSGWMQTETTKVGTFPPNRFGLHEMHGNVWEHCADNGPVGYGQVPNDGKPFSSNGPTRVLRGGSWSHNPAICRAAYRDGMDSDLEGWPGRIGVRLVCEL
ncbi:SUMF1/EgtB/PvdO family nonheme iron enzyme [Actinomycetospora lutea]|uniref:SUMF1/EgtB/PvdO family nonheme iron enzyme n=1 Tax=Actinomycetospora lutea TaxID=663604 RepID=UPI002366F4E4|nr:SUMF1/EgtB/PvdO family nonheme iron enzyme [Actinomycetospora lutea]MDD7942912.1 SUMF1/EgtB/PvdO family nonheme iron enzyme [Actinomycetospora lutea]